MAEILAFAAGCQQAIGFHLDVRKYHGLWAKPKSQRNAESPRGERAAVLALAHRRSDQPLKVAAVLCALALALDVPYRVIEFLFAVGLCSEPETFCVV